MSRRNHFGQTVDEKIVGSTNAAFGAVDHFTDNQRDIHGLQTEVGKYMTIDFFHLSEPTGITRIRLALEHQDAFDDTLFLRLACQGNKSSIGVVVVFGSHLLQPIGLRSDMSLTVCLVEYLDAAATDGDIDDTHTHLLGQVVHHHATKVIARGQARIGAAERRSRRAPLAHLPAFFGIVNRVHHHKAGIDSMLVDFLHLGTAFHIALPESQIDVKVFVLCIHHTGEH